MREGEGITITSAGPGGLPPVSEVRQPVFGSAVTMCSFLGARGRVSCTTHWIVALLVVTAAFSVLGLSARASSAFGLDGR